jgi:hypothetical protein
LRSRLSGTVRATAGDEAIIAIDGIVVWRGFGTRGCAARQRRARSAPVMARSPIGCPAMPKKPRYAAVTLADRNNMVGFTRNRKTSLSASPLVDSRIRTRFS